MILHILNDTQLLYHNKDYSPFCKVSWDIPCKIWYKTITTPGLISPNCTFVEFAQATLTSATELYGSTQPTIIDKLRRAWQTVKVL